jgi:AcrR family transcriptional regulator
MRVKLTAIQTEEEVMARPANPELVDTIVRVTARTIDERGIEGVTVRGIAEAAGCSPTIIYHYFGSKDGLLHRAVQLGLDWFVSFVRAADAGGSGIERIRATSHAYVVWGIRNQSMYRLMFERRMPRPASPQELEERRSGLDFQRALLAQTLDEPKTPIDPSVAAELVFVSLHGTVSATISDRLWGPGLGEDEMRERTRPLVDRLVDDWSVAWGLRD